MDFIFILLLTFLLYGFFWIIVKVFVASDSSNKVLRIKAKIFFHSFVTPIVFGLLILLVKLADIEGFSIYAGVGVIIGSLISTFSGERKYLTGFITINSHLEVGYLTVLLKQKKYIFKLTDITNIEMDKAKWLINYPILISIKSKKEWIKFYLVDIKIKSIIEDHVNEVTKSIATNEAVN
jgi:hypothetical protein